MLLVVGMHRSGTSLLGGLLQRLGVALPGETIAGDQHNPEGYFEWDQVVSIQERLLIDLERWWPSQQGVLPMQHGWHAHPASVIAASRLRQLLSIESARQQGLWAIKDPRVSRLLPLWIRMATELDLSLQLLLAVRDPAEVTASLLHRDGPLVGMDVNRAQQLWWRHNLEVVRVGQAANLPLDVIDFGRWFVEPEAQLELLLSALPSLQPTRAQRQSALDLVRPEHRRSASAAQKLVILPELRRLHQRLLRTPLPRRWPDSEPPRALCRQAAAGLTYQDLTQDPSRWKEWLELHRHYPAPRFTALSSLGNTLKLNCCGASWCELPPHQLMQRLPFNDWGQFHPNREQSHAHELVLERRSLDFQGHEDALERICLNLELPEIDRAEHWLSHLRTQQLIWDPDHTRVLLLRALGLPAWWLDVQQPSNDWLRYWLTDPSRWKEWLELHRYSTAPCCSVLPSLNSTLKLKCCGASWCELIPHLMMQRLPFDDWGQFHPNREQSHAHELVLERRSSELPGDRDALERLCLNLELPAHDRAEHWLGHLRTQQLIWDPDPARVMLLRALGLPAWWLDVQQSSNDWLQLPSAHGVDCWGAQLGLPMPTPGALLVLGHAGRTWDQAYAVEGHHHHPNDLNLIPIDYLPGWPKLMVDSPEAGWAQAGWLQAGARVASRLVIAGAADLPAEWALLADLKTEPMVISDPMSPSDLRAIHQGKPLMVLVEERPAQQSSSLFEWISGTTAKASVLVSLFNYGGRITEALESVSAQRIDDLELIVVDDASLDDGASVVVAWMEAQLRQSSHPFARLLLLQHSHNAGLAAARNSGFAAAQAPWCFVLDADNALFPEAVEACLKLAGRGSERLAVVHPLIAVEAEPGRPDEQRSLVRHESWQRQLFAFGNLVDAMALVRRSSWEFVGGYTHIEGGWEDFDFWCKLIEADFYGVQSPHVLAVYRSHVDSMSYVATNRSWRALSCTLQARHPWLSLPLAEL